MSRIGAVCAGLSLLAGTAAAQAPPELLFQAEAQTLAGRCAGQPVRLEGNHNTVALTGACGSLLLKGVANTVQLGIVSGGSIHVEGSGNRVSFVAQGAAPAIVALGPDNDVAPGAAPSPPAPPSPAPIPAVTPARPAAQPTGPLVLTGDDAQRIEDCAGREAAVTGNRSAYLIRGGCKSLTVRGNLLAVQAELDSGAKVSVTGRGNVVSWTVKGKGRPPVTVLSGEANRVQRAEPVLSDPAH